MRYETSDYRGRFAPTPSGPLHLGSLVTALASYLQARTQRGRWLLRFDDLDGPRVAPGAESLIQRQLELHGLLWDGAPRRQSEHLADYEAALQDLQALGLTYPCSCTRATLARESLPGADGPVYSGRCRDRTTRSVAGAAMRIRAGDQALELLDGWQGPLRRQLDRDLGDFTLRRADGQIGYQLACVVDESAQRITEVVRGVDLLGSTFRQLFLMNRLAVTAPRYRHLPLVVDQNGAKLSKQNHAAPLEARTAADNLLRCLRWLNQAPPANLETATVGEILAWAIAHWTPREVPARGSFSI